MGLLISPRFILKVPSSFIVFIAFNSIIAVLYFVRDVEEGEVITNESVRRIRPGYGLHPQYLNKVIGSKVKKDVSRGDRVSLYDVDL